MNAQSLEIGPLCRYFAADEPEAVARVDGVLAWREDVRESLAERLRGELYWPEDPHAEPRIFAFGRGELDAVRLLAVHADRPELDIPDALPDPLGLDPIWAAAESSGFDKSRYGHLGAAAFWLPWDFDFTFRGPRPDGADATFGSLPALRDQVSYLNARTFQASDEGLLAFCDVEGDRFVDIVRRGLGRMSAAVRSAADAGLPLSVRG
ncbi:MAG: hypothetical protein O3B85_14300 [Planctomycetota bacterium]|nr:hypothetical protein [Planctomycetota bacterium]